MLKIEKERTSDFGGIWLRDFGFGDGDREFLVENKVLTETRNVLLTQYGNRSVKMENCCCIKV